MKGSIFNDDDMKMYVETFTGDIFNVHYFWNYRDKRAIRLTGELIPDGVDDPFEFMRTSGDVAPSAQSAFNVFCGRAMDILNGRSTERMLYMDVPVKLSAGSEYTLCHFNVVFGSDSEGNAVSANMNIIPYNEREIADRRIIDFFTSDKAPEIFDKRIRSFMEKNPDRRIVYIQFDVERFKLINDTYGVEAGDELLKYLKDSISVICSDKLPFCRLTADIFMIVTAVEDDDEIIEFIRRIEDSVGSKYKDIEFRLAWGVAIAEDRSVHTRKVGDNATLARKSVKGSAVNNIGFYNGSLKSDLYYRSSIEDDMARAVENDEFEMFLQPKYSISTGRLIGAEALARWRHPTKGLIPPNEFIPIFEKNGFIVNLDQVIWEKACKKLRYWLDNGIEPVPVSVNISREYLHSFDVVGKFTELVKKYDIPLELLEAEITESVDSSETSCIVKKMKEQGFTMLMDDFGSGFSSLNVLKTTPFDVLKIDRGFLSEFMESDRGRKIISHTISMSRDIGLDIVAEGVETGDQARFLYDCGCDAAQGFYYSKPVPADEFDKRFIAGLFS